MANKSVKVVVLEGDFASLIALGFPLSLSLQLQEGCLKLNQALWTAKSTKGRFSVSLFWSAPDGKSEALPKRRRKRKRRSKASTSLVPAISTASATSCSLSKSSPEVAKSSVATQTLNSANHHPGSQHSHTNKTEGDSNESSDDEKTDNDVDVKESVEKTDSDESEDAESDNEIQSWIRVSGRRKKAHLPLCWKLRFPVHLRAGLRTPSGSSSELSSNGEENDHNPTPVAARTRSKLKS